MKDLEIILAEGESNSVEFKETVDKTIASEVCAFANASGGKILIGVTDKAEVIGTDISNAARSRIQDTINKVEPMIQAKLEIVSNIIVIAVPPGHNKPYSCPQGFYMRFGPNSQKLSRDDIVDFFQTEGKIRYDEIVRTDLPLTNNFDESAYKEYIQKANISPILEKFDILSNLSCAEKINDIEYYTNAGALFFRTNENDLKFNHARVTCALYKGNDKVWILDTKDFEGSTFENIDNAVKYLKNYLRTGYKIQKVQRENILEIPEDALREAITNAVCHRDYFEKGARVMVEIFDDRIEISSPGGAPKGINSENFGKKSITRNSVIASMLHRITYIEKMGTGIKRIKEYVLKANQPEPKFESDSFFTVTFMRPSNEDLYKLINPRESGVINEKSGLINEKSGLINEKSGV
ncbi:MAG: ATP-binding protein, partial [Anaerovoracaceae bacterium]